MGPSFKAICILFRIPLVSSYRFLQPDEIVPWSHEVRLDPDYATIVGVTDGTRFNIKGVGFSHEEAFNNLVNVLKACMERQGVRPAQNLRLAGQSYHIDKTFEVILDPDLDF